MVSSAGAAGSLGPVLPSHAAWPAPFARSHLPHLPRSLKIMGCGTQKTTAGRVGEATPAIRCLLREGVAQVTWLPGARGSAARVGTDRGPQEERGPERCTSHPVIGSLAPLDVGFRRN